MIPTQCESDSGLYFDQHKMYMQRKGLENLTKNIS